MKAKFQIVTLILTVVMPAFASAQFILGGELRPRAEYRHGFKSPATTDMDAAAFVSQRSRLNLAYKNEKMKIGFSLQDVRVWGDVPQLNLSDNSFSVHEAWGEYMFTPALSLKAGRMELVYDDARMLGNVDWAQQGRSHDIGLIKYEKNVWKFHAGLAYNQDKEQMSGRVYTVAGNYKTMQLLWANYNKDNLNASFLFLNNGKQDTEEDGEILSYPTRYSQTLGGTATYQLKPITFNASIYKQLGKEIGNKDMDALMLAFNAKWSITNEFSFTSGFEYMTGTSQRETLEPGFNQNKSFNPFYGTNHKFNGHMDYYYVGNHINSVGLQDIFFKVNHGKNRFSAGADLHLFSATADIMEMGNPSQLMDKNLGQELDLYIGYKLADKVTLNAGYSQYFATESTTALKGGNTDETSNWAWISLTFKPEFLNTGKQ
ncbi:MAG: alginate export family protein [Lentimicrobium sp.]|nr:alginate export family protein [Lentimicrobium sp.]